jgi:hypothetical protein
VRFGDNNSPSRNPADDMMGSNEVNRVVENFEQHLSQYPPRLGTYLWLLFMSVVATFDIAFRLGWISEQYHQWKIPINGKMNKVVSCGRT